MSKAEERALEKYPLMSNDDKEGLEALKYIGMECECASVFNEAQEAKQTYFIEGYNQAEKDLHKSIYKAGFLDGFEDAVEGQYEKGYAQAQKDLELTLADIEKICLIAKESHKFYGFWSEIVYDDILKRFKAIKETKD